MRHYEEKQFADWLEESSVLLPELLRRSVFARSDQGEEAGGEGEEGKEQEAQHENIKLDLIGEMGQMLI